MSLRLLSYNIRFGGRGREEPIAAMIRAANADIVMLQEATDPRVVEKLAELTEMPHCASRLKQSTGFLSRIPVSRYAWMRPPGARHPFLEVVLDDGAARIFGLHLSAWFSKWNERIRAREIRSLLDGIADRQAGFHVIAGDFNALAPGEMLHVKRMPGWIRAMVWVSGRDIARDTIQHMLDAHYIDAWRTTHPDDEGFTFPTWDPHVRLDYVFTPDRYRERVQAVEIRKQPDGRAASDHYPLLVEFA